MQLEIPMITENDICDYMTYLREQERSQVTLKKYQHDLYTLMEFLMGSKLTKTGRSMSVW